MTARAATCLWFEAEGHVAARTYVSLLPGSRIVEEVRAGPDGPPLLVLFELAGAPFQALNGGPGHPPTDAASIAVATADQAETDRLWDALCADGGEPGRCGWLRDRWGVSWQIVPEAWMALVRTGDGAGLGRAFAALGEMGRIDMARLEAAYEGA
ncbi:VOC family protein [Jannaschia sp. W003]|uniref:VOC family protein n=1 Tax=Jannaschia sp. W003 TaxID=2867012 RepID=UPI0021A35108|nr:VOC family protein [Jannaschia sp. W003]UWQ22335.1 VOC family protein [Jannaschia sp. W003]